MVKWTTDADRIRVVEKRTVAVESIILAFMPAFAVGAYVGGTIAIDINRLFAPYRLHVLCAVLIASVPLAVWRIGGAYSAISIHFYVQILLYAVICLVFSIVGLVIGLGSVLCVESGMREAYRRERER